MQILLFALIVLLFVVLTPGVVLTLPPNSSKLVVALTHGVVFALVFLLLSKPLLKLLGA